MARRQNYYYTLVMTDLGPVFVTSIDISTKTAHWDKKEKPMRLGKYTAEDLTLGLTVNGNMAFTVCSHYELDSQPYMYEKGKFEWKWEGSKDVKDNKG